MNTPLPASTSLAQLSSKAQFNPATVRRTGWALIFLGPCLSAGCGFFALTLLSIMHPNSQVANHPRWHGGPEFTRLVFELGGTLFLLGMAFLAGGIYQVRAGRRHPVIVAVTLLLAGVSAYFVFRIVSAQP